jgi:hypothetical protein
LRGGEGAEREEEDLLEELREKGERRKGGRRKDRERERERENSIG